MAGLEVSPDVHIYDDVLDSPGAYRAAALAYEFQTFDVGGSSWRGFASCQETELIDWLRAMRPDLTPTLSLFRKSPYGQIEPNFVHTDRNMGDWTLLYYLASAPEAGDGTNFYRHRWSGVTESCAATEEAVAQETLAWDDTAQWELRQHVPAKFNRAVLFPAGYFHSRAIFNNYGHGDTSRLMQVVFCKQGV